MHGCPITHRKIALRRQAWLLSCEVLKQEPEPTLVGDGTSAAFKLRLDNGMCLDGVPPPASMRCFPAHQRYDPMSRSMRCSSIRFGQIFDGTPLRLTIQRCPRTCATPIVDPHRTSDHGTRERPHRGTLWPTSPTTRRSGHRSSVLLTLRPLPAIRLSPSAAYVRKVIAGALFTEFARSVSSVCASGTRVPAACATRTPAPDASRLTLVLMMMRQDSMSSGVRLVGLRLASWSLALGVLGGFLLRALGRPWP